MARRGGVDWSSNCNPVYVAGVGLVVTIIIENAFERGFIRDGVLLSLAFLVAAHVLLFIWFWPRWRRETRAKLGIADHDESTVVVAFFHPFCASGGGGERVLWKMVHTLAHMHRKKERKLHVVIYAAEGSKTPREILAGAEERFDIDLLKGGSNFKVDFVFIEDKLIRLLHAKAWPRFTMIGQSFGSMRVAWRGLQAATPDLYFDTTGAAFTLPLASLAGARCAAYVHYPTISTDMLAMVYSRRPSYNHDAAIASSKLASLVKCVYYFLFAAMYSLAGSCAYMVLVNSSWTKDHIEALWRFAPKPTVLYPPVNVEALAKLPFSRRAGRSDGSGVRSGREPVILSVAQFRPEKDHPLQLRAFARLLALLKAAPLDDQRAQTKLKLVLLGACRGPEDQARIDALKKLAVELGVRKRVEFILNCPFTELQGWLGRASIGLHTMWNEHFGIGVVEFIAAGVVTVAHATAGPKQDIIVPTMDNPDEGVGYLASDVESFAGAMQSALRLTPEARQALVERARERSHRFSDGKFALAFRESSLGLFAGPVR